MQIFLMVILRIIPFTRGLNRRCDLGSASVDVVFLHLGCYSSGDFSLGVVDGKDGGAVFYRD